MLLLWNFYATGWSVRTDYFCSCSFWSFICNVWCARIDNTKCVWKQSLKYWIHMRLNAVKVALYKWKAQWFHFLHLLLILTSYICGLLLILKNIFNVDGIGIPGPLLLLCNEFVKRYLKIYDIISVLYETWVSAFHSHESRNWSSFLFCFLCLMRSVGTQFSFILCDIRLLCI